MAFGTAGAKSATSFELWVARVELVPFPLSRTLNKRYLIDLFQRGQAQTDLIQGRFTQEAHAFLARGTADFRCWLFFQDHFADAVTDIQKLMDRGTPTKSGSRTLDAALAFVKGNLSPLRGIEAAGFQDFWCVMNDGSALVANQTHKPLGQNAVQSRNEVVRLDSHVEEAADDVDHVVGVDGGEDQVTGQG